MTPTKTKHITLTASLVAASLTSLSAAKDWVIDSTEDWQNISMSSDGLEIEQGQVSPTAVNGSFQSKVQPVQKKTSLKSVHFEQSAAWLNWDPIPNTLPPVGSDAPVFLALGPNDYWIFRRSRMKKDTVKQSPEPNATLEGFDIPLWKTSVPRVFNAEGAFSGKGGGYHAWQSRDMVNWVHHGAITEKHSRWTTTAEYADGKLYVYYDFPNDQDPHVYVDDNLFDGIPGKDMGMAFKDPSHGSDCAIIRGLDGKWHLIYEDWSPINAQRHAWDSPLAGHAVSDTGLSDFKILDPAVDERTNPTGEMKFFSHPHWSKEDPDNYPKGFKPQYEVHEPAQRAFGDWAAISIGGQYYLFGDYEPAHINGKKQGMSTAWFTSSSIYEQFEFCGNIGKGHPDPDIGFAEGQFYLLTQTKEDFVSPGPWVETVEARAGVDTNKDGAVDQWTVWQEVKESYDYIPGFAKQIERIPAKMDTSSLPSGYGFAFEFRVTDTTENVSKPVIEKVTLSFQ
ncbi:MAG: hypothetical protein ACPGN3_15525 [Opitutales bacterium]